MDPTLIQKISIYALPVIFAITLHEAAHGYVARHFGDPTAWQLGRISLNPARHIDPVGDEFGESGGEFQAGKTGAERHALRGKVVSVCDQKLHLVRRHT